jgi:shikimate dehydrogenase
MVEGEKVFGLIGYPLAHSSSPGWFAEKFAREGIKDAAYRLFPLTSIEKFPFLLLDEPQLAGLNVTIPYKVSIVPCLDELDEIARSIGAVNTIKFTRKDGVIRSLGFNTDAPGFLQTLTGKVPHGPALILGTGGGAKAVAHALKERGDPFLFVSRNKVGAGIISYNDLTHELISNHLFIINTTPLGMHPGSAGFPPIPYHFLSGNHYLYDLVYNPEETEFIKRGKAMNARTMNGRQMLINQAELSYRIFFDKG